MRSFVVGQEPFKLLMTEEDTRSSHSSLVVLVLLLAFTGRTILEGVVCINVSRG